jgi:M6 family metalloprotease-like protein
MKRRSIWFGAILLLSTNAAIAQQDEWRCGMSDSLLNVQIGKMRPILDDIQQVVLVMVDFPDGRIQPGNIFPTTDSQLGQVENINAVGSMGWIPEDGSGTLRQKARKYTYDDYWDWIFSEGSYLGIRHPDYLSHGTLAFGSVRDYYEEVSYGNLTLAPGHTWNTSPNNYKQGIVNGIDEVNGQRYIRWIMMPNPKSTYSANGPTDEVLPVLDALYNNGEIDFNRQTFSGQIIIVAAGSGDGGVVANTFNGVAVREKLYTNSDSRNCFDGIWVLVHEYGHTLGFGHVASGTYCPMNPTTRNWYPQLYCPPHVNPWAKMRVGWIPYDNVIRINSPQLAPVTLYPVDQQNRNCAMT